MKSAQSLQELSNLIVSEINKKNYEKALRITNSIQSINRTVNVHLHHLRSIAYQGIGDLDSCIVEINKALKIDKNNIYVNINKAKLLSTQGLIKDAIDQYLNVLKISKREVEVFHNISALYSNIKDYKNALKYIEQGLVINKENQGLLYLKVKVILQFGKYEETIENGLNYLTSFGESSSVNNSIGLAYKNLCKWEMAIKYFQSAIEINPSLIEAKKNLASCYQLTGNFKSSKEVYEKLIQEMPLDLDTHHWLNNMLWETGNDAFLNSYNYALQLFPNNIAVEEALSEKLYFAGKCEQAYGIAKKYLFNNECTPSFYLLAIDHQREAGNFDEALRINQFSYKKFNKNKALLKELAKSYIAADQSELALKILNPLVDEFVNNQEYLCLRNTALKVSGSELYYYYCNFENFILEQVIETPAGYSDLYDFNHDLLLAIKDYHYYKKHPLKQSLVHGSQTAEKLFDYQLPILKILENQLRATTCEFINKLPKDSQHPFLRRNTGDYIVTDSWSVILTKSGYHKNHYHPQGWMSSPYYIQVPSIIEDNKKMQGWLKLGEPGFNMYKKIQPEKIIKPEVGKLIQFPSYLWHGTTMLEEDVERITIAYDVIPN